MRMSKFAIENENRPQTGSGKVKAVFSVHSLRLVWEWTCNYICIIKGYQLQVFLKASLRNKF